MFDFTWLRHFPLNQHHTTHLSMQDISDPRCWDIHIDEIVRERVPYRKEAGEKKKIKIANFVWFQLKKTHQSTQDQHDTVRNKESSATILIANVRKTPHVAKIDSEADNCEEELNFLIPCLTFSSLCDGNYQRSFFLLGSRLLGAEWIALFDLIRIIVRIVIEVSWCWIFGYNQRTRFLLFCDLLNFSLRWWREICEWVGQNWIFICHFFNNCWRMVDMNYADYWPRLFADFVLYAPFNMSKVFSRYWSFSRWFR